jgi:oxygen-independent coproporphyrinogen-3 oxidase
VVALFVFIPFCKIKCTYCDFNAYANLARMMEPYADAVAREIEAWESATGRGAPRLRAKSIYFGGGTPSIVPVEHIGKILTALREGFHLEPDAEITLEANPGTVDLGKLQALAALGINRLSLGVQSFDDATVRRLNRGHTAADALETFRLARRAGFDNINLDFIYGLPLQTVQDWRATLEQALALAPEHLSLYALKVEEGTGLEHQIRRGKYPMPDDDAAADMYELAEDMLDAAGYEHYEISNWAKSGDWRLGIGDSSRQSPISNLQSPISRHNLTYWYDEPYLGFGAGAHSYFAGERYWNVLSPVEYVQRVNRGASPVAEREVISRELEMAETMILGLRLGEGVAFKRFAERFGQDVRDKYAAQLRQVAELGLVELQEDRVRLTRRGRLLSNEVFWRFLPD